MIVFGVTHSHDVVRRKTKLIECCLQSGLLVDAGGQCHHCALIEAELQLPSFLMVSRTAFWCGSHVATTFRPTENGTPRAFSSVKKHASGGSASERSSCDFGL